MPRSKAPVRRRKPKERVVVRDTERGVAIDVDAVTLVHASADAVTLDLRGVVRWVALAFTKPKPPVRPLAKYELPADFED